jgi:alpha-glucosidase
LHLFDQSQPDFNWNHPDVSAEFQDTIMFWLQRGVDGFRVDVAPGLVKARGYPDNVGDMNPARVLPLLKQLLPLIGDALPDHSMHHFDQPEVHGIYRQWRRLVDECAQLPSFHAVAHKPAASPPKPPMADDASSLAKLG